MPPYLRVPPPLPKWPSPVREALGPSVWVCVLVMIVVVMIVAAAVHLAEKRRLITMSTCCITTVQWLTVPNVVVANEVALHSTSVSLSSACSESNSC